MDRETTLHELKEKVKKFSEDRDWDKFHGAKDLAIGLITEASEVLEHFRFLTEEQIEDKFKEGKEEIAEELADVMFFLFRIAQKHEIDLADAFNKKLKKNEKRYPIEKSKGRNDKYNEL